MNRIWLADWLQRKNMYDARDNVRFVGDMALTVRAQFNNAPYQRTQIHVGETVQANVQNVRSNLRLGLQTGVLR